ncbi:hypothetical protein BURK1_02328 [Burkholderiales bacterium]|nr:hypothetical protein BURK1_02328 [Burkholderiales bacterium]
MPSIRTRPPAQPSARDSACGFRPHVRDVPASVLGMDCPARPGWASFAMHALPTLAIAVAGFTTMLRVAARFSRTRANLPIRRR